MEYVLAHPFIALIGGFGILSLAFSLSITGMYRKWNRVFGKHAITAPEVLQGVLQRLLRLEARANAIEPRVNALEVVAQIAVQKVGFLRFNPFNDTGGDQSFVLALLDSKDTGVVISSLYTREGVRVYAKEIQNGNPKHQLSDEETRTLREAIAGSTPKITNADSN